MLLDVFFAFIDNPQLLRGITLLFCNNENNIIYSSSQLFNERDMTMKKRVVVASDTVPLGTTLPEQKVAAKNTSKSNVDLIEAGFQGCDHSTAMLHR